MAWNEGLLPEQEAAAGHIGAHGRLLAGPGTGKTYVLTRRVEYLVSERGVAPQQILALTFTRAAAAELRERVRNAVGNDLLPPISTLHAFSLRQLLRNRYRLAPLPLPLRIADDWEERHIIEEDLKAILDLDNIRAARELITQLAADWQSLDAEHPDWQPDARFIGAWQEHREIYGYTLRSELVYQLKRGLEQIEDFDLEFRLRHLLIDEYQDLNRCDLAVMRALARDGVEVFCAGDDDQSIYGFRKAHPDGIRNFPTEYDPSVDRPLSLCKRCDPAILQIALFVAALDARRIPKTLLPEPGRSAGEVALLRFATQAEEAQGVATMCKRLVDAGHDPGQILILLRTDRNRAFSKVLQEAFDAAGVPITSGTGEDPFGSDAGMVVMSYLRLTENPKDHLAWRALLQVGNNRIGTGAISQIYEQCRARGERFADALERIAGHPQELPRFGNAVSSEVRRIEATLRTIAPTLEDGTPATPDLPAVYDAIASEAFPKDMAGRDSMRQHVLRMADEIGAESVHDILTGLAASDEGIEQTLVPGVVNLLTMHKAKGLTAETVFVVGVEDEHIPGRQQNEPELGDERRLLYVSLTRAKHRLFCTYCNRRTGQQAQLGRTAGNPRRTLTRFLRNAPLAVSEGMTYSQGFTAPNR